MAYTVARTWVTAETVTAALLNTHLRDNMNATAPGIASAAGNLIVTDGTNSIVQRTPAQAADNGSGTLTNTSSLTLANLTGGTPFSGEVEVTVTTGTKAFVLFAARLRNDTVDQSVTLGYSVSGASTVSASFDRSLSFQSPTAGADFEAATFYFQSLTAGSNTFTLEARVTANEGTINDPRIAVLPL